MTHFAKKSGTLPEIVSKRHPDDFSFTNEYFAGLFKLSCLHSLHRTDWSMEAKRTPHECPICKDIIYNDIPSFHDHLIKVCGGPLFTLYPALRNEPFNVLWYKLTDLIKQNLIIPSGQKGVAATVHPFRPQYAQHPQYPQRPQMDLDAMDHQIDYLQNQQRQRLREQAQQRKRYRRQMEQDIRAELKNDEFTRSMPQKVDETQNGINGNHFGSSPKPKKRRLLYHNTSDIRPPKRVNIDPEISVDLLRHKIRESRREYHNVSFLDFAKHSKQTNSVDQKAPIIHTQRALSRYLLNCEVLRKCFHGELFEKIGAKFERVYGRNYENLMTATLREIKTWNEIDSKSEDDGKSGDIEQNGKGKKEKSVDLLKEAFLSSWDAIPQQTELFHLNALLRKENLSGRSEEPHSFWNGSNNVKCGGYDRSMFDNAKNKKFIKL